MLAARGLTRRYGGRAALDAVDLDMAGGESVALLGPNGAGKTTLLGILAGVIRSDAGEVTWPGGPPGAVGWVPQQPAVYARLTARENLRLFTGLEGADDPDARAADLLARADLHDVADRRAGRLSTGTLQRLNLAVALAGRPSLLLLDEPTATLSPDQRLRLWDWLHELRAAGGPALLFSTQSVGEAARHGERLVVLAGGHLRFSGTPSALVDGHGDGPDGDGAAERAFLRLLEGVG